MNKKNTFRTALKQAFKQAFKQTFRFMFFGNFPDVTQIIDKIYYSNQDVEVKINQAYQSLLDINNLINQLEHELKIKTENVKLIKAEYEKFENVAKIEKENAEPLLKLIDETYNGYKKGEFKKNIIAQVVIGLLIFFLGAFLGPMI